MTGRGDGAAPAPAAALALADLVPDLVDMAEAVGLLLVRVEVIDRATGRGMAAKVSEECACGRCGMPDPGAIH